MTWTPVPGVPVVMLAKAVLYAAIACVVSLSIGTGAGIWIGVEWQQGRQAQRDVATLGAAIKGANDALLDAQGAAAQISRDAQGASTALNRHSKGLSDDIEHNRKAAAATSELLEYSIARNPALADCGGDADFMRAWNAANRGDSGGAANAAQPGAARESGSNGAMPGGDPAGSGQQPSGAGSQSPGGDGHLPRLQGQQGAARGRGARSRAHRGGAHRASAQGDRQPGPIDVA